VEESEAVRALAGGRLLRHRPDRGVGRGQRGVAEEDDGREALDLTADHAIHVAGLDLAFGSDRQALERPLDREAVDHVAEGVGRSVEAAIAIDVDPPVDDELSVVAARRQAKRLDRARRRRVIGVGRLVDDAEAHGITPDTGR
jgi:hypothetical protein